MSSTALIQSPLNKLTRTITPNSDSPITKIKSAITLPILNITPLKAIPTATPTQQPSPASSTPGRWQHPRMDEIVRRQNVTTFDKNNVRACVLNSTLLVTTFAIPAVFSHFNLTLSTTSPYPSYLLSALRLLLLALATLPLLPLLRSPDLCEDIPLTPQQRHTLGLPPTTRALTPLEQTQIATPPRYSRNNTPTSTASADSLRVQARGSPLSGRGGSPLDSSVLRPSPSPYSARGGSGSPYSASPMQSSRYGNDSLRRSSFGSTSRGSPVTGIPEFENLGSPGTKSGRASVGLNSKWLYERGRGSPGAAAAAVGSGWGTGSVFN